MMFMLCVASAFSQLETKEVAVVNYQVGVERERGKTWAAALLEGVVALSRKVQPLESTQPFERSAMMCGEDVPCLATVGAQAQVRYLLAFGLVKVGADELASVRLVDVDKVNLIKTFTARQSLKESATQARQAVQVLFEGVPIRNPMPIDRPSGPVASSASLTSTVPRLRPLAWTLTGVGAIAVASAVVFGVLASQNYAALPRTAALARPDADARQRQLNLGVDVSLLVAALSGVTAAVVFALPPQPPKAEARP
jgi:hypothetical protein